MKQLSFFSSIALSLSLLIACTGNSSSTNEKESASADPVSGTSGTWKDMLYEYKLTTSGNSNTSNAMSIQSDTKMYVSSKGDMRVEMNTTTSYKGKNSSIQLVTLGHADKPNESTSIDDATKTYSVNHFDDNEITQGLKAQTLSVTKAGEEKVLGFNSVHARIITKKFTGTYLEEVDTMDIWRSNDVPMVESVKVLFDRFESKNGSGIFTPDAVSQLKQMGCEGFMTKMEIHSKRSSTKEELVKVEHRDLPANMFQVPEGYTESKE
jgi:hypothetical protein